MRQIERVRRARSQLVMGRHPFYGCLALNLKLETSDGTGVGTMATDGKRLVVNEDWVSSLSDDELRGVIVHEVMHIAYGHPFRRGRRDPREWNVAGDFAINRDLLSQGFTLPDSRLYDPQFDGLSAEQIYARRVREAEERRAQQPQRQQSSAGQGQQSQGEPEDDGDEDIEDDPAGGQSPGDEPGDEPDDKPGDGDPDEPDGEPEGDPGDEPDDEPGDQPDDGPDEAEAAGDPGGCGEVLDAADPSNSLELEEEEAKWKAKVLAAAAIAKAQAGDLPAEIERLVSEQRAPARQDWRQQLRRFVTQSISRDHTWARPNRRFIGSGLYLPSLQSDAVDHVLIAIDTSGSIDSRALSAFAEEMQDIFGSGACDRITVVYCDRVIHGEPAAFTNGDSLVFTPVGGGGTDFAPVTEWAAEQQAACLIYLTDLLCRSFGTDPGLPVLWARWGAYGVEPPFGDVIEIDPHA